MPAVALSPASAQAARGQMCLWLHPVDQRWSFKRNKSFQFSILINNKHLTSLSGPPAQTESCASWVLDGCCGWLEAAAAAAATGDVVLLHHKGGWMDFRVVAVFFPHLCRSSLLRTTVGDAVVMKYREFYSTCCNCLLILI